MRRKLVTGMLLVLCVTSGWLTWDNVFADPAPVAALADQAACKVKSCAEHHGMTKMDRSPIGQTVEITWRNGSVVVHCSRAFIVAGERSCSP